MEKKELIKKVEEWRKFGEDWFYMERYGAWICFLQARLDEKLKKVNFDTLMKVVKTIDLEKNFQKGKEQLDYGTVKDNYELTLNGIALFAKNGIEFYQFVNKKIEPQRQDILNYFKKQNRFFERNKHIKEFYKKMEKIAQEKEILKQKKEQEKNL